MLAASAGADRLVAALPAGRADRGARRPDDGLRRVVRRRRARCGWSRRRAGPSIVAGNRGRRVPAGDIDDAVRHRADRADRRLRGAAGRAGGRRLAAGRRHPAARRSAAGRRREDHRGRLDRHPAAAPLRATRSAGWQTLSTACCGGSNPPAGGSGRSSPTRRTSCARRWPACAPSSTSRSSPAPEPDTADLLAEVDRLTALVDDLLLLASVRRRRCPAAGAAGPRRAGARSGRPIRPTPGSSDSAGRCPDARRWRRTRPPSPGCWPTCWTTPSATPGSA